MSVLKELRKKNFLKQQDLAKMLGVDRTTVTKWESGAALPRADKLIKMALLFNCTVDELLKNNTDGEYVNIRKS